MSNVFKVADVNRDVLAFLNRDEVEKMQLVNKSLNILVKRGKKCFLEKMKIKF